MGENSEQYSHRDTHMDADPETSEIGHESMEVQAADSIRSAVPWEDLPDVVRDFFNNHRVTQEGYDVAVSEFRQYSEHSEAIGDLQIQDVLDYFYESDAETMLWLYDQMKKRWDSEPETFKKLQQALLSVATDRNSGEFNDERMYQVLSFAVNARVSFSEGNMLFHLALDTYIEFLENIRTLDEVYTGTKVNLEQCQEELRQKAEQIFFSNVTRLSLSASAFQETVRNNYKHVQASASAFAIVFKEVVKHAKQTGEVIDWAEFANTSLEVTQASELDEKVKQEIVKIFTENRASNQKYLQKNEHGQTWLEYLTDDLQRALDSDAEFYILKHSDDIVGFIRFDQGDPTHIASFNVNSAYKDGKIGGIVFRTALELKGQDNHYVMEAEADNPALSFYVDGLGFTPGAPITNYKGFSNTYIPLERKSKHERVG